MKERIWWLLGLVVLVMLGIGVQLWAATQWSGNFDSDEAIFALMTRHLLLGATPPTYMYGNSYLGAGESWLAAGLVEVFSLTPPTVLGLRLGNILLYGIFLLLQGWLVYRLWKYPIALVAVLFTALPGALVLWWFYRPIGAFGLLMVCGTGMLLLSHFEIENALLNYGRLLGLGILMGVGLWSHQMIVVYAAVVFLLWMLQSPEWRQIHRLLPPVMWPFVTIGLGVLVIVSFFSAACPPQMISPELRTTAQLLLLAAVGWSLIGFFWVSERQDMLLRSVGVLGGGFLIGNYPQWQAFVLGGAAAQNALVPSCPAALGSRANLLLTEIIPHIWGTSWLVRDGSPPLPIGEILVSFLAMPLMIAAVVFFVWYWRYILGALVSLRPLVQDDIKIILVGALFVLPLLLALFGGNTVDVLSTRYLLLTWQASTIIVGWFVVYCTRYQRWAGVGMAAVLILQIATGYGALADRWQSGRFEPEQVAQLEQYLVDNSVYGGYADYWDTYTLNFLMDERIVLTPMSGINRFPRYTSIVEGMSARAYILPREFVQDDSENLDALITQLQTDLLPAGLTSQQVIATLQEGQLLERGKVASWDVWIVAEPVESVEP